MHEYDGGEGPDGQLGGAGTSRPAAEGGSAPVMMDDDKVPLQTAKQDSLAAIKAVEAIRKMKEEKEVRERDR